jgi:formylglycine-generating enzyme required for sulfatase activity
MFLARIHHLFLFAGFFIACAGLPASAQFHSADTSGDNTIDLSELLRVIQFYNSDRFHCAPESEDGYNPGPGDQTCAPHNSDYNPQDWRIELSELLRLIQFYNSGGYHYAYGTEDDFATGAPTGEGEGEGEGETGTVVYSGDSVSSPGNLLIFQGQEYDSEVQVPEANILVGVVSGSNTYLYHPALGDAPLSQDTTRRAIGYWIVADMFGATGIRTKDTGDSWQLDTGLWLDQTGDTSCLFQNQLMRWAAVVTPLEFWPAFLAPQPSAFDSDYILYLQGLSPMRPVDLYAAPLAELAVDNCPIRTYGSVASLLPYIINDSPITASLSEKISLALAQDPDTFVRLNAIDYLHLAIGGIRVLLGNTDFSICAESLVTPSVLTTFVNYGAGLLSQNPEDTAAILWEFRDVSYLTQCLCELTSSPSVCASIDVYLNYLKTFDWIIDETLFDVIDVVTHAAFAELPGMGILEGEHICDEEPEPGQTEIILLPGGVPLEMVWSPGGSFMMGSYPDEQDRYESEEPRHQVTVKGFWMGKYEVTQAQWSTIKPYNSSLFSGPNRPVEMLARYEANSFIKSLNDYTRMRFRLPSEAEWEYACRAGTTTRFYWGDDPDYTQLGDYAWYTGNSGGETHEVGGKLPNAWGLYDMIGNVAELCEDDYHGDYVGAPTDGSAWVYKPRGMIRILRGGSWLSSGNVCRSASRGIDYYDGANGAIGFRLVR